MPDVTPEAPTQDPEKKLAGPVALGAVALAGVGFFLRKLGKELEPKIEELALKIARERVKERAQPLIDEKMDLDFKSGLELSIGTGLVALGIATALAAALVFLLGVRARRAVLLLFPALLFVAVYSTYMAGVESLAVTGLVGIAILAYATSGPDEASRREIGAFRNFPTRVEIDRELEPHGHYREAHFKARLATVQKLLRSVHELPPDLARLLPVVGEGRPFAYYQLKKGIAYVAVVEADAFSPSDFVTILMSLEEPAPRFVARPLPIVEGKRVPNTGVRFKDDPEFTEEFLVEPAIGSAQADVKAVRDFLTEDIRDALLELPSAWLVVERTAMAVTLYGRFDADRIDALVELADVLFAEYGAQGGPSLFRPDGAVGAGGAKKKKKQKPAAPEDESAAPPAS